MSRASQVLANHWRQHHMSLELVHPTLVHPRTGDPIRALGVRANGDPIWPIMGGDGTEDDANDDTGDNGDPDDQDDQDTGDNDGDQDDQDQDGDEDARVKRANRQAASYRTQLRESQKQQAEQGKVLEALRKALGGKDEDDPAQLLEQANGRTSELETQLAEANRREVVRDLASAHNANAAALLDSRSFNDTLAGLDPEADDYRDQVADAIKSAVSKNGAYRAGQGSSRGGAELHGEQRERQQTKRPKGGLHGAIGAALNGK